MRFGPYDAPFTFDSYAIVHGDTAKLVIPEDSPVTLPRRTTWDWTSNCRRNRCDARRLARVGLRTAGRVVCLVAPVEFLKDRRGVLVCEPPRRLECAPRALIVFGELLANHTREQTLGHASERTRDAVAAPVCMICGRAPEAEQFPELSVSWPAAPRACVDRRRSSLRCILRTGNPSWCSRRLCRVGSTPGSYGPSQPVAP